MRNVLTRDFSDLIDMRDFQNKQPHEWEPAFLSRALAALAVRNVIGCSLEEAAMAVIDGRDDFGIDAVAISETSQHVWLIQSKWSDTGRAGFNTEAAHKFVDGLHQIDQRNFHRFNERLQRFEDRLRAVLRGPSQITLVLALMGPGELSSDVRRIFDDEVEEMNGYGPRLDYRVFNARDLWQQVREAEVPEPVTITATMRQWIYLSSPVEVYQAVVSADDIAQWAVDSDGRLFTENIRESLGASTTEVNVGMLITLKNDPDLFLHFNNGITVLCDSVGTEFPERRRQASPVTLTLHGASVVNGAQTVTAIHQAMRDAPDSAADADVSVHVRRAIVEMVTEVGDLNRRVQDYEATIKELIRPLTPALLEITGISHVSAAVLVAEIGNITRFSSAAKLARYVGCAPIPVYSSDKERHRLHRGGNRRLNSVLYTAAIVQKRFHPGARELLARHEQDKGARGARRILQHRLIDVIHRAMLSDRASWEHHITQYHLAA